MDRLRIASLLVAGSALTGPVLAYPQGFPQTPASLVGVSVELDGQPAPLFPAPDGSGRYYLEARPGSRYSVALANRTGDRIGVILTVDGLNAISGERDAGRGRMYVLDPWQRTTVQGWRTSLQDVRRFTFVDERASYAARSGKANEKMGWIEIAAYRERRVFVRSAPRNDPPPAAVPLEQEGAEPRTQDHRDESAARLEGGSRARAYPGTGWGPRTHDPVVLVRFDPEPEAADRVTLRYEYRPALVALGILPRRQPARDRLWERDHAEPGFAQPPAR